jgi:hypothetical protein
VSRPVEQTIRAFSGIYPHLAVTNDGRFECGIGAIVPWQEKLWFITYTAHAPAGSQDKLYQLDTSLQRRAMEASVGGTNANRMIHAESRQLNIGPYFIDEAGGVRALPLKQMPGRITATKRHLSDPESKVYLFCMEGELYEVDVATLEWRRLFGQHPVAGSHAKGGYTADGRITISNNGDWGWFDRWKEDRSFDGDTGVLAEWDGRDWKVVQRLQFTEVMGPGGLTGQAAEGDPLWAVGWDKKSVLLNVRQWGKWQLLRLPKGSYTHDGGHGWHTEWPRIRQLEGTDQWLMTMHGMLYDFPPGLTAEHRGGLRPIANFHKMIVDFCRWQGRMVLACNDASTFDNPLLGRCQSNLWWTSMDELEEMGAPAGWGGVWLNEAVAAGAMSDPMLINGFGRRTLHLRCDGGGEFELQTDQGDGCWQTLDRFRVNDGYTARTFNGADKGRWARLRCVDGALNVTAYWHLGTVREPAYYRRHEPMFRALPAADGERTVVEGIIRPRSEPEMPLQYIVYRQGQPCGGDVSTTFAQGPAGRMHHNGRAIQHLHYRVNEQMEFEPVEEPELLREFEQTLGGRLQAPDFEVDSASALVREADQVYRLPRGPSAYDRAWTGVHPRGLREVVTERSLWNIRGTFYEMPRDSSGGVRRMRPLCTHNRLITDFCSWRGMLVLAGHDPEAAEDEHFVRAADGRAGLWLGTVDDLWKLGKPVGRGGPWRDTPVEANHPSDPYLMTGFDEKSLTLWHDSPLDVRMTIEIDFLGDGSWSALETVNVAPNQRRVYPFAEGFMAHWARLRTDRRCIAGAWFEYW